MKNLDRTVLTILRHEGQWAIELAGVYTDHGSDKEIVRAAALRRARQLQDSGAPCQVRVAGETGWRLAR